MEGSCHKCGKPSSSGECPNCRYRHGGDLPERDEPATDLVETMLRTRVGYFTADQLQQILPNEP